MGSQLIDKNIFYLTEIKKLHQQYHQLAGEYVAYVSMSSVNEAKQVKQKLDTLTEKLISSLKELDFSEGICIRYGYLAHQCMTKGCHGDTLGVWSGSRCILFKQKSLRLHVPLHWSCS